MFNFKVKYISVYVNGVFYEEADDYTFDNRTGVFVFANKFNADEKVTITVAYIDNSYGSIDNTYEDVYERVKYYDNFSNVTDLNFDVDKFNSFVLDFTKDDNSPITPISIHLPDTESSIGKSIIVTLRFGAQVPIIIWSDNIVWENNRTPTFRKYETYIITINQIISFLKYTAKVSISRYTKILQSTKEPTIKDGTIYMDSGVEVWDGEGEPIEEHMNELYQEAAAYYNISDIEDATDDDLLSYYLFKKGMPISQAQTYVLDHYIESWKMLESDPYYYEPEPECNFNWYGTGMVKYVSSSNSNIEYDRITTKGLSDYYFDPTVQYILKHSDGSYSTDSRCFTYIEVLQCGQSYDPKLQLIQCTLDLNKYGLLFTDINLELNASNVEKTAYNQDFSYALSSVGDNSIDVYSFTNTTIRDTLATYLLNNITEDIPIRVIPK